MGQSAPTKLAPADVRDRVKGLRLDEVLGDEALLKQATSASTAAFQSYRFVPIAARDASPRICIAGIKLWYLGHEVSLENATAESSSSLAVPDGFLTEEGENQVYESKSDSDDALVIRFEQPTAVNEFSFRTPVHESRDHDPVRFKLYGCSEGNDPITLFDQTDSDFATPNTRGSWTPKIGLKDMAVSPDHVDMQAARKLADVIDRRGVEDLALWATDKVPRAPVDEAAGLVECCRVQLIGETQRRREELFSMVYAASEATLVAAKEADAKKERKVQKETPKVGTGIAALTARCAVHLILESQMQGAQPGLALDLLTRHLADGSANLRLPPKTGDMPEALEVALTTAAEICRDALAPRTDGESTLAGSAAASVKALRGRGGQGPKVAELLLRLAALRGSFGDALAVVRWLVCEQPDADLRALCAAVQVLYEIYAGWKMEAYDGSKWTTDDVTAPRAVRSKARLTAAQLEACGTNGVYAEAHLVAGTTCRVGFVPCVARVEAMGPDDIGVGFQSGKSYFEGDLLPLEGADDLRNLRDGDTIGLCLRRGQGVEVFVNGVTWGKLPKCDELEVCGCFFAVAALSKEDEVVLNVGQQPFKYSPPVNSISFANAAGVELLNSEMLAISCSADELLKALLEILSRNADLVCDDAGGEHETSTYESNHPYANYADQKVEVHVPGARSMKITFDQRCKTESGCDFLRFYADEQRSRKLGQDYHGSGAWPPLVIEGDRFWYHFTSDSSQVEWGFKFTVDALMPPRPNEFPLCLEPTASVVSMLIDILQQPRTAASPKLAAAVLKMVPTHVSRVANLPAQVQRNTADVLLRLARERSEVGAASAHVFGDCCSVLFSQPVQLMRAQMQIWREPDGYHPDAVAIVSKKFDSANSPLGSLVDDVLAPAVFDELVATVANEASIVGHQAPAARLLWRTLSDAVSYLIAERAKMPSDAWTFVLKVVEKVFELGAATAVSLSDKTTETPPGFLRALLLPLLYGMAAVPNLHDAPWGQVVTLIQPVGSLARACGGVGVPAVLQDLQPAALALLAKLGRAIIGEAQKLKSKSPDEAISEALLSPLLCIVPCKALGKDYAGPPIGVSIVEQVTGSKLMGIEEVLDLSSSELIAEVVDLSSERAKKTIEALNAATKNSGRAFFPDRIRRLLFSVLVKQFRALDSLQLVLDASGGGEDSAKQAVQKLWTQAQRLEPWLLSVKQRQVVAGRDASAVLESMEQALELLIRCTQSVELDVAAVDRDDDGLEALWQRQMPLVGGSSAYPRSPSLRWGGMNDDIDSVKRLQLLLQEVPAPGANVPAQHVKSFFEGKWFGMSSPLEALFGGIQDASVAVWRRAAGLSLLAWAAEQCAASRNTWAAGAVLSALCESWREETSSPRRCAEASSVMALALAREQAVKAMTRLAQGSLEGEQGQVLQVMALAGLAGPWRCDDHDIVMRTEVMSTLRPHLPWAGEGYAAPSKQQGRASWLAFESISAALAQGSAGSPVLRAMLSELQSALPGVLAKTKRSDGPREAEAIAAAVSGGDVSLLDLFGAKVDRSAGQASADSSGSTPPAAGRKAVIADLRRRLEAKEDFGGLENDPEKWSRWLERVSDMVDRWEEHDGRQTVEELERAGPGEGDEIQWRAYDIDGDGTIDIYEVLRVLLYVARRHPGDSEFETFPSHLPIGLPRFSGDVSLPAGAGSKTSPLDLIPTPEHVKNAGCAILKSIDGLMRAQRLASLQDVPCSDEFLDALLQAATDSNQTLAVALLALRLLRNVPVPSGDRERSAARQLLQSLVADSPGPMYERGTAASLAAQRAEVLRAWIGIGRDVGSCLTEALADPAQAAAALYVVGAPPSIVLLGSALAEGENDCLVVDAQVGGAKWTFYPCKDSSGNDIECYEEDGGRDPEVLKQRCFELGGVAFNTNGWIKRELKAQGEWEKWTDDETQGLYVVERDNSVAILRDGNGVIEEVNAASLQLRPRRCDVSKIGPDIEQRIIDVALQKPCPEAWSLGAVLAEPGAASYFVQQGGMGKWLRLALGEPFNKLAAFSPADRSNITATLRAQFPGKYKEAVDAFGSAGSSLKKVLSMVMDHATSDDVESGGDLPFLQQIEVRCGDLIDKVTFVYSNGTKSDRGQDGGGMREPFKFESLEFLQSIQVRHGDALDAIKFVTNTGRESPWYGNSGGGKGPYTLSAEPGNQIHDLVREGSGCHKVKELIQRPAPTGGGMCKLGVHKMARSETVPAQYESFTCSSCGKTLEGSRWHCPHCSDDCCYVCRPPVHLGAKAMSYITLRELLVRAGMGKSTPQICCVDPGKIVKVFTGTAQTDAGGALRVKILMEDGNVGWVTMRMTDGTETLSKAEDTKAEDAAANAGNGAAVVRRATRVLGEPQALPSPEGQEVSVPKLDDLLLYAKAVLSQPPALRVVRLHGLQEETKAGKKKAEEKNKCGLVSSKTNTTRSSSSVTAINGILWNARGKEQELQELVLEAVAWDQQVLALEICLVVVQHFAASTEPSLPQLGPPQQLAQLCLAFENGLDGSAARARARTALSNLACKFHPLVLAYQQLSFAHLLGSLGLDPKPQVQAQTFESRHPYGNNEKSEQKVSMPGAKSIVITFDPKCCTEGGCDILRIFTESQSWQRDGGGTWNPITIEQDHFTFSWYSDGSCTDWGYCFTATPDMPNIKSSDQERANLADGLMLLEFLVDLLPGPRILQRSTSIALASSSLSSADVRGLLRQEFAALLLAHVERNSTERLVALLQRFLDGCTAHGLALDWLQAQHALEAMTVGAQASGEQAVLQRCVGLRLSLPEVKVATEQPRFVGTRRVLLLDESRVCTGRTRREAFCQVLAGALTSVTFARLTEKQAWVGAAHATQGAEKPNTVCMISLSDGNTLINNSLGEMEVATPPESLKEMRVLLDVDAGAVTFECEAFSRTVKLPPLPEASSGSGGWMFAAKLGEFGSSVRVTPTGGISDSALQQLRETEDVLSTARGIDGLALQSGIDFPDTFILEAFTDWWSSCSMELREEGGHAEVEALREDELFVRGAGIAKFNGKYTLHDDENDIYMNEAGCRIYQLDARFTTEAKLSAGMSGACMSDTSEADRPVYVSALGLPWSKPWFSVDRDGGTPPVVYGSGVDDSGRSIQKFSSPPASTSDPGDPYKVTVSATQIFVTNEHTVVLLVMDKDPCYSELKKPVLLYTERDCEPKPVARCWFHCFGTSGCLCCPTSEWAECERPALLFRGGPSHSIEHLFRGAPGEGRDLSSLYPKLAVNVESAHPLPASGSTSLRLSVPDASGLTLHFSSRCKLPPDMVVLASLDEAGERPAVLKPPPVNPMLSRGTPRVEQDAARGIIAAVSGQSFKLDASECFLRFPMFRPVQWEPLALALPVVEQSDHPYKPYSKVSKKVCVPGSKKLRIDFHTECCTEGGYDNLRFYSDEGQNNLVHSCSGEGPWAGFNFPHGDTLWYSFTSDESNEHWGYHFTVSDAGSDDGLQSGIGLLEGIPELFDDGVQLGGDGTLLFVGTTTAVDVGHLRPVTTLNCEVTNVVLHEGYNYGTMDNIQPDVMRLKADSDEVRPFLENLGIQRYADKFEEAEYRSVTALQNMDKEGFATMARAVGLKAGAIEKLRQALRAPKGSQSEWYVLPTGWSLVPNISVLVEHVVATHSWGTDLIILEDGTAYGTKSFQEPGGAWRCQALQSTLTADGKHAFKPSSDLARILIRKPANPDKTDLTPREEIAEDKKEETEDGYIVRHSFSVMTWLRPGVLAGELTVDFTGAPLFRGDLAVGITPVAPASLVWPSESLKNEPDEKPAPPPPEVMCEDGHNLQDLGTSADNGWGCDGRHRFPGGCKGGFTGFGQTRGVNRYRCRACDYDLCETCYRYEKNRLLDEHKSEAPPDSGESWWWRCDGALLNWTNQLVQDPNASFGAGDVVGMLAYVEGSRLTRLVLMRNGLTVGEDSTEIELPEIESGRLAFCVAVRRSSVCVSLLPTPKLIEHLPSSSERGSNEEPMDGRELAVATVVFKAMDASGDGALQREEITHALGGSREEIFQALDASKDGKVSLDEWLLYCRRVKCVKGADGIGLFLEAFRKKLVHIGRAVILPDAEAKEADAWGIQVVAIPRDLNTAGNLRAVKECAGEDWDEFQRLALADWTYSLDSQVVAMAEWLAQQARGELREGEEVSGPADLLPSHLRKFGPERRQAFPTLTESESRLMSRLVVLQLLNRWVKDRLLPFCDLGELRSSSFGRRASDARELLFSQVGREQYNKIVEETFTNVTADMRLNRHLATACKSANECDTAGESMLFAQASKLAESIGDDVFRSRGGDYGRPLCISYQDEEGVDQGGLYRDFLDACATELLSPQLPLLMPTPNAQNNAGECREAWMVAPTPTTKATKRMLHFLGRLMGICVRRGDVLPLSLSRVAWKLLVGDEPGLEDLLCDDVAAGESVRQLGNIEALGVSAADFDLCFGEMFFVYSNSARIEVPLVEGGSQTRVTFESAKRFAELVQDMRLHEAAEQIECIRTGMASVVPVGCFSLWSWRDLELRVCGNPKIDVKVLRRHTRYDGVNESDEHVQYLWQALESFSQQDLQRFLRFVWGRSRLPPEGSKLWREGFKIASGSDISRNGLPRAHTCFFQIDLPRYDDKHLAEERILFAIRNCVSMQIS